MDNQFKRMQLLAGIKENDGDDEFGVSLERARWSTVLKPLNSSVEEVEDALNDIENYGMYKTQAIRNASTNKAEINKAIDDYFGPSIPSKKKAALKARGGEPFPIKTKQAVDDFIAKYSGKPKLLSWEVDGDVIIFKQGKNPGKKMLKDVIAMVMSNADIEYKLSEREEI